MSTLRTTRHTTQRRRAGGLLPLLALGALIGVIAGVAGYLMQSAKNEQRALARENMRAIAEMSRPSAVELVVPPAPLSRRVEASPLPIYTPALVDQAAAAARAPSAAAVPAGSPVSSRDDTAAQASVRSDGRLTSLLAAPATYLTLRTHLGSAQKLRGFLGDRARAQRYTGHPIVQAVLSSPTLIKALLRPAVVRAFVASPAMQDKATVKALLDSQVAKTVLASPGVQAAVRENMLPGLMKDPPVADWLGKNPQASVVMGSLMMAGARR